MTHTQINQFLASKKYAIAGVSRDKKKFANVIFKELKKKGFDIIPINPNIDIFEGEKCYKNPSELPSDTDAIIVVTNPVSTENIVVEAVNKGIKQIFIQQGAHNDAAVSYAEKHGANIISKKCILMIASPGGLHKIHQTLAKWFGAYPKK